MKKIKKPQHRELWEIFLSAIIKGLLGCVIIPIVYGMLLIPLFLFSFINHTEAVIGAIKELGFFFNLHPITQFYISWIIGIVVAFYIDEYDRVQKITLYQQQED